MRKNESGRSMVEMLGVLAIIGVLSIGGIAGYTLSMNRYRANSIVDAANKYASLVFGSCQSQLATAGTALSSCKPTSQANLGIVTEGDVAISADTGDVAEGGVTVTVTGFPTTGVQDAYAAIVNENTGTSIEHFFPQN